MIAKMDQSVDLGQVTVQEVSLPVISTGNLSLDILRLDKIHTLISGNKWFKLKYTLQEALAQKKTAIVTFGGAYSNHVLATAAACKIFGLQSMAIIRGDRSRQLSCTLKAALELGMHLEFVSRSAFADKTHLYEQTRLTHQHAHLVEEGGMNENGILGSEEILTLVNKEKYQYICCAVGTGTMLAGIVRASMPHQEVLGISSLKINNPDNDLQDFLMRSTNQKHNYQLNYDYHFGGYAKHNKDLFHFMNDFFIETGIPTDFVYTGKLLFSAIDLVKKSYFKPGSSILLVHSGGLQGNCSLPKGSLLF